MVRGLRLLAQEPAGIDDALGDRQQGFRGDAERGGGVAATVEPYPAGLAEHRQPVGDLGRLAVLGEACAQPVGLGGMAGVDLQRGSPLGGQRPHGPEHEQHVDLRPGLSLGVGEGQRRQDPVVGVVPDDDGKMVHGPLLARRRTAFAVSAGEGVRSGLTT